MMIPTKYSQMLHPPAAPIREVEPPDASAIAKDEQAKEEVKPRPAEAKPAEAKPAEAKPAEARPTGVDSNIDILDRVQEWEGANLPEGEYLTGDGIAGIQFLNWLQDQEGFENIIGRGEDKKVH